MSKSNRVLRLALNASAIAAMVCTAGVVRADDEVIEGKLRACVADGTAIGGVNACGKRWKLKSGEVDLERDGDLEVEIKGLVLDDPSTGESNGTPDGVTHVVAALVCGGSGGKVVAESDRFALGKNGHVEFETKLRMPGDCKAPVVLIREVWEGKLGGWLAVTGF